jgi:hypothetical protein
MYIYADQQMHRRQLGDAYVMEKADTLGMAIGRIERGYMFRVSIPAR